MRLVLLPPSADGRGGRIVRRVAPGVVLPGIAAVEAVTVPASDGDGALLTDVRPVARIRRGAGVAGTLAELLAELADDGTVPVGVVGTPFTRDVLAALARIPVGGRRTYAALAAAAGRPHAVRAAASVMARNRVPLVLPCHRVVPSCGSTGRYGWGEDVKVALLDVEARATVREVRPAGTSVA